jgi:2-methylcitrate dehydratase PrpD
MTPAVTEELGVFAAGPLELPDGVLHAGERTVANALPLAVASVVSEPCRIALATVAGFANPPEAAVLGGERRLAAQWAAFVNGLSIHVEDFDDTHLATIVHPAAPVVPAALACAERVNASGRELLEAVIVGVEVALRVGIGVSPSHFDRGWHITSTTGHFGAAAAAGRVLELPPVAMVNALGIVATQVAGVQAALGTMTKAYHPGKAAADGVEAALLAEVGFSGPTRGIEGPRGFAAVTSDSPDPEAMLAGLGDTWELTENAFKPYACGIVSHPAIDAAIALRDVITDPAAVTEIEVTVNPVVLDVMGDEDPTDGLRSKFSVYHCVAVGLMDGAAGPAQFTTARATDPETRRLRSKVGVRPDPGIARDAAWITARAGGAEHTRHILHATGSARRPMSDAELRQKARLANGAVPGDPIDGLTDAALALRDLERARELGELSAACSGARGVAG